MNRIMFMTELAALLQDISAEERVEAMRYYNNYFDDAGEENEQKVIEELGSPKKVAAEVKAGLRGQDGEAFEYRETGYANTRFEHKEPPAGPGNAGEEFKNTGSGAENKGLKIFLIVLIAVLVVPVVLPAAVGLLFAAAGILVAVFAIFITLVVASVAIAVVGVAVFIAGLFCIIPELAVGFALIGSGMVITVVGAIASVASVKLCIYVFPRIVRGIVWVCRRPFHGRKAVAS